MTASTAGESRNSKQRAVCEAERLAVEVHADPGGTGTHGPRDQHHRPWYFQQILQRPARGQGVFGTLDIDTPTTRVRVGTAGR